METAGVKKAGGGGFGGCGPAAYWPRARPWVGRWRIDRRLTACFITREASFGGMMGQAFSLRVPFRPQPKAALPWAGMNEAVGLAEDAAGLVEMKAVGFFLRVLRGFA